MASVALNRQVSYTYMLELTQDEADFLASILGRFSLNDTLSAPIYRALRDADGVKDTRFQFKDNVGNRIPTIFASRR